PPSGGNPTMRTGNAVWITGVGTATPLGATFEESADGFLAGCCGIRPVTRLDVSQQPSRIAAGIDTLPAPPGWDEQAVAGLGWAEQLFVWCAVQALRDAGWWERRSEPRLGLVLGYGAEGLLGWEADWQKGGRVVLHPEQERASVLDVVRQHLELT